MAHFIWFGKHFPWVNELALHSAAYQGQFEKVVLHYDGQLNEAILRRLERIRGFVARPIEPEVLFGATEHSADLIKIFSELAKPNAQANMVRAAVLYAEGGVYLDMDTVTLRAFAPHLQASAFCGEEYVAWPAEVKKSSDVLRNGHALFLDAVRMVCASVPTGWKWFRAIESYYPRAVNNAVLGAEARHPFIRRLIQAMVRIEPERRKVPFALGTHLLQTELAAWDHHESEVTVHAPEVFYPLGPVISHHWFRRASAQDLEQVVSPRTTLVHWYASVRNRKHVDSINLSHIQRQYRSELFSALVQKYVGPTLST